MNKLWSKYWKIQKILAENSFGKMSVSKKHGHRFGDHLNFIIRYLNPDVTTESRSYFYFKYYTPRRVTHNVIWRPVWLIEYFETGSVRKCLVWCEVWWRIYITTFCISSEFVEVHRSLRCRAVQCGILVQTFPPGGIVSTFNSEYGGSSFPQTLPIRLQGVIYHKLPLQLPQQELRILQQISNHVYN